MKKLLKSPKFCIKILKTLVFCVKFVESAHNGVETEFVLLLVSISGAANLKPQKVFEYNYKNFCWQNLNFGKFENLRNWQICKIWNPYPWVDAKFEIVNPSNQNVNFAAKISQIAKMLCKNSFNFGGPLQRIAKSIMKHFSVFRKST